MSSVFVEVETNRVLLQQDHQFESDIIVLSVAQAKTLGLSLLNATLFRSSEICAKCGAEIIRGPVASGELDEHACGPQ